MQGEKNRVAVGTIIADRPPQSGRIVARSGLRMMPTFPPSPYHSALLGPIRPTRRHIAILSSLRLIRDAFAVWERLGDPRAVPSFRCALPSRHAALYAPGRSKPVSSSSRFRYWPSLSSEQLGSPGFPAIRFKQGSFSGFPGSHFAAVFSLSAQPLRLTPRWSDSGCARQETVGVSRGCV